MADEVGVWWETLRDQVSSRWALLKFLAHRKRKAEQARHEDADEQIIRRQQAEAISALRD